MVILSIPVFITLAIGLAFYFNQKRTARFNYQVIPLSLNVAISIVAGALGSVVVWGAFAIWGPEITISTETHAIEEIAITSEAIAVDTGESLIAVPGDEAIGVELIEDCDDDNPTLTILEYRHHDLMPDWAYTRYTICR